ncbi:MAG: SusD/RagB family nutrient-binding outer membrane lipoprotein [Bacteroidota bacterium]
MNYKRIIKVLAVIVPMAIFSTSCDNGFAELNTNPSTSDNLDGEFLLNFALNRAASSRYETWRGNLIYTSQWAQQLSGGWAPNNYQTTNEDWLAAYWNEAFGTYMRNIQDIINQEEGTNLEAMAMIFKVMIMQRVTDMYGDIPYSEAFQGGTVPQPAYDTQEEVYNAFISELRQAIGQLSAGNGRTVGSFDPIYNGDIDKWRMFGNSLLLRVGMRLSEVNSTLAEETVAAALSGGVFSSNDDMAWIEFDGSMPDGPVASGIGEVFNDFGVGGGGFNLSDEFLDRLQAANDPREKVIAVTYNSDGSVNTNVGVGQHMGRVNGRDVPDAFEFAMPNHAVMTAYNSPVLYLTYAEVEFNRAEAITRGWANGDAQEAYENGIRAACQQLALYPGAETITDQEITDLLANANVAWDAGNAMNLINTQKWISLLFDGFEAYANYRRTGYPELTVGETVGESNGTNIPGRMRYPVSEILANSDNYDEAVNRLSGGDVITENVWWDAN